MKKLFLSLLVITSLIFPRTKSLPKFSQAIVVTTADWKANYGKLNFYEKNRHTKKWEPKLKDISVVIGVKGMAWGIGLHDSTKISGKIKHEGDTCSPAGIFKLVTAFGASDISKVDTKMNYFKADSTMFCVDDVHSKYYNRIVNIDSVQKDWKRAEKLKLKSHFYKYCIFVGHNTDKPIQGRGSCIFIHLWDIDENPPEKYYGTSGCTAMSEENIIKLFKLLDKKKNPLLIQMPEKEYLKFKKTYRLPKLQ